MSRIVPLYKVPRVQTAVGLATLAAAGWWAFAPLPAQDLSRFDRSRLDSPANPSVGSDNSDDTTVIVALDLGAFSAPLWVAPPPPPASLPQPAPPPPPPPLKLQLLAVVSEDGMFTALFHDPDADTIVSAREGESLAGRILSKVEAEAVELTLGTGVPLRLALREEAPNPGIPLRAQEGEQR
ncbi:MAG: hypothetical protein H7Y88_12760 [Phycisphaerales bacterium]|nr:hypothetical protein [Phycisphaerales bacterium]